MGYKDMDGQLFLEIILVGSFINEYKKKKYYLGKSIH
jgi:hypothetical protein